jgi:hypothetical protein
MIRTTYDGIVFIEGDCPGAQIIKTVSVRITGIFSFTQAQLKSLDDVKKKMASLAKKAGGNAIIQFKYGQRCTIWTTLMGLDDVGWYGDGVISQI